MTLLESFSYSVIPVFLVMLTAYFSLRLTARALLDKQDHNSID